MNIDKFAELLKYIKENNSWGDKMYEVNCERHRVAVKYVDATFDSRDGQIFGVKLRSCVGFGLKERDYFFRIDTDEDLKKLYEFLDKERKA